MGTRADFYRELDGKLDWLGSIAWDGYPSGLPDLIGANSEADYLSRVAELSERDDWTSPETGWPWPWKTSKTTDCAYVYREECDRVLLSWFGCPWLDARAYEEMTEEEGETARAEAVYGTPEFQNMEGCSAPAGSERSGVILVGVKQ